MLVRELQDLWIAALESGAYKQGKGQLCMADGSYCCLGVACELLVNLGLITKTLRPYVYRYDNYATYLPRTARDMLGLYSDVGAPLAPSKDDSLAAMNDAGLSFECIANLLKTERTKYFDPEKSDCELPVPAGVPGLCSSSPSQES